MSSSTTSGANSAAAASARGPSQRHAHVVAHLAEGFCQAVGRVLVVVDDEDAPARCAVAGRGRAPRRRSHRPRGRRCRQGNHELATRARAGAVRLDAAAMQLDQRRTIASPRPRPPCDRASVCGRLREQLEHVRQQLGRDAHARVTHARRPRPRPRVSPRRGSRRPVRCTSPHS